MPSRGSYQISNIEEGKAAQRDQSFRSCILTLLIFFFLCIILILGSLPWKSYNPYRSEQTDQHVETAQHHRHHEHDRTSSTTSAEKNYSKELKTTSEITLSSEYVDTININSSKWINNNNNSSVFEETTAEVLSTTDKQSYASISTIERYYTTEDIAGESTTAITDFTNLNERYEDTTEIRSVYRSDSVGEDIKDSTGGSATENYTKLSDTDIIEYEEHTTEEYKKIYLTHRDDADLPTSTKANSINVNDEPLKENTEETESSTEYLQETSTMIDALTDNTISHLLDNKVCNTGECKNYASKMLSYMNHTIDPCEDFYEYACGGFEADSKTIEQDLEYISHQRILRQIQKGKRDKKYLKQENTLSLFVKYYESCIRYEDVNQTERIQLVKEALDKIGRFYSNELPENHISFTELIAKLLSYNSALLFDVAPDLNEYQPKHFTLRIGPTIYNSPFNTDSSDDPCYDASQFERENKTVYLQNLYAHYKTCKNNTKKFMKSVKEALTALGIFDNIQLRDLTINFIDIDIMKKFNNALPTKDKIREAYLMKNYTLHSIMELGRDFKLINWTQLIYYTTNHTVNPETKVQVYFYDVLADGLKNLEKLKEKGPDEAILLHNALLGLYAHDLYHQFVVSKYRDIRKYCLRVAANVLIAEASYLYISSFSEDQLAYMNKTTHDLFEDLKTSLKQKIESVKWPTREQRKALITKVNDLKIVTPNVSYFNDTDSTYRKYEADKINLKDNYFENSMILMQRYRKLMYAEFALDPGSPEHVWTHYATPYQSKGLAIYGLNLVVIPFGAIDWSIKYNEPQFDYIKFATLGYVIAHQIAHHFDANGIYYWNGTRDANNILLNNNSTNIIIEEYINIQRNYLYPHPMNTTLASTEQTVVYEIPQLTLNERLSEIMGVRLAYDTLDRLRSPKETILPWLQLNVKQLFYLTYAQMHCTKSPLTSSYISLYENEQLPSRIRIFVTASNTRLIGEAWKCLEGSQIMPSYFCNAFP